MTPSSNNARARHEARPRSAAWLKYMNWPAANANDTGWCIQPSRPKALASPRENQYE